MTAVLRLVPAADHSTRPCSTPACGVTGRLYPCGWRCARHAPGPAITPVSRQPRERNAS